MLHSVERNCEIRSLCDARDIGYAAAPAHALEQTEGFLFKNCRFTAEPGVTDGSIYLARPWRDYGLSRFENCTYGQSPASRTEASIWQGPGAITD